MSFIGKLEHTLFISAISYSCIRYCFLQTIVLFFLSSPERLIFNGAVKFWLIHRSTALITCRLLINCQLKIAESDWRFSLMFRNSVHSAESRSIRLAHSHWSMFLNYKHKNWLHRFNIYLSESQSLGGSLAIYEIFCLQVYHRVPDCDSASQFNRN